MSVNLYAQQWAPLVQFDVLFSDGVQWPSDLIIGYSSLVDCSQRRTLRKVVLVCLVDVFRSADVPIMRDVRWCVQPK